MRKRLAPIGVALLLCATGCNGQPAADPDSPTVAAHTAAASVEDVSERFADLSTDMRFWDEYSTTPVPVQPCDAAWPRDDQPWPAGTPFYFSPLVTGDEEVQLYMWAAVLPDHGAAVSLADRYTDAIGDCRTDYSHEDRFADWANSRRGSAGGEATYSPHVLPGWQGLRRTLDGYWDNDSVSSGGFRETAAYAAAGSLFVAVEWSWSGTEEWNWSDKDASADGPPLAEGAEAIDEVLTRLGADGDDRPDPDALSIRIATATPAVESGTPVGTAPELASPTYPGHTWTPPAPSGGWLNRGTTAGIGSSLSDDPDHAGVDDWDALTPAATSLSETYRFVTDDDVAASLVDGYSDDPSLLPETIDGQTDNDGQEPGWEPGDEPTGPCAGIPATVKEAAEITDFTEAGWDGIRYTAGTRCAWDQSDAPVGNSVVRVVIVARHGTTVAVLRCETGGGADLPGAIDAATDVAAETLTDLSG